MEQEVRAQLSKLSTQTDHTQTPHSRLVKPLSVAFQSTGALSKRNRQRNAPHFTPETPIKRRNHPWIPSLKNSSQSMPDPVLLHAQNTPVRTNLNHSFGSNSLTKLDHQIFKIPQDSLTVQQLTNFHGFPVATNESVNSPSVQRSGEVSDFLSKDIDESYNIFDSKPIKEKSSEAKPFDSKIRESRSMLPMKYYHGQSKLDSESDLISERVLTNEKKKKFRSPLKESPVTNKKIHLDSFASPIAPKTPTCRISTSSYNSPLFLSPSCRFSKVFRSPCNNSDDLGELSPHRERTSSFDVEDLTTNAGQSGLSSPFKKPSLNFLEDTGKQLNKENSFKKPLEPTKMYQPLNQHIPYSIVFSRKVLFINKVFFDAAKGDKEALKELQSKCSLDQDSQSFDFFESEFRILAVLGEGTFGHVFHIKDNAGGEYALKKTRRPFLGYKDAISKLKEVENMLKIGKSAYCVQLINAWLQSGYIYIQMELCQGGSLGSLLDSYCRLDQNIPEEMIWRILGDICSGLSHIHGHNMAHLDIKPANIFISQGNCKIGDFGMATSIFDVIGEKEGDRVYLAPEVLSSTTVGCSADIFSLGLVILEMAALVELPDNGPIWQQLREGALDDLIPQSVSPALKDLIKSMLAPNPSARPDANAILKHPILNMMAHVTEPALISSRSSNLSIS